jgi:hypothetical protein
MKRVVAEARIVEAGCEAEERRITFCGGDSMRTSFRLGRSLIAFSLGAPFRQTGKSIPGRRAVIDRRYRRKASFSDALSWPYEYRYSS